MINPTYLARLGIVTGAIRLGVAMYKNYYADVLKEIVYVGPEVNGTYTFTFDAQSKQDNDYYELFFNMKCGGTLTCIFNDNSKKVIQLVENGQEISDAHASAGYVEDLTEPLFNRIGRKLDITTIPDTIGIPNFVNNDRLSY